MIKSHIISLIILLCLCVSQKAISQYSGIASYYSDVFDGRTMANGECYNPDILICAHPTAPLGSFLKVSRRDHPGYSIIVKVTDRGPFVKGRVIDLSKRAAKELDILHQGIADVIIAQL